VTDEVKTSDEWSVRNLDLDAYLQRVGYDGPLEPSGAVLSALHRAHLSAIPFENLDLMLGRGVRVDFDSIQAKLVYANRGGYCYEHGQLFGAVLERLGFQVDRLLARVGPDSEPGRPRTHLTLRAQLDEAAGAAGTAGAGSESWIADVGFGNSPPGPLSLRGPGETGCGPREPQEPQDLDGWIYQVAPGDTEATWKVRELQAGEWVTLYTYEDRPVYPADVVVSNHYTATYPASWFTWQPIVARRYPDATHALVGRMYTITTPGHVKNRRMLTDEEFAIALSEVFGLIFTDDELATLVAAGRGVG
jgi:N-hydroxyarylamine O-acetyltransferase